MARRSGGLDAAQLQDLAAKLLAGGRARVRLSGPQFPPDTVGTVVRIGDPAVDGEDYVFVRTKVRGVVDELGFSPAELAPATRATKAAPTKVSPAKAAPANVAPAKVTAPDAAAEEVVSAGTTPTAVAPAKRARRREPRATPEPAIAAPTPKPVPTRSAGRTRRAVGRPNPSVPVTISIASSGEAWTLTAERGARALVKHIDITPGTVTAIAALLGDAALAEAVANVNDAARNLAEARAEQLRAELAQIQAVLDSHRSP